MLAKSPFSNLFLFIATAAAFVVHLATLNLAPTQFVLRVVPLLDPGAWLRIVAVAASILVAMEVRKVVRRGPLRPREIYREAPGSTG